MGMQEYGIRLVAPERNTVKVGDLLRRMEQLGYRRLAPSAEVEGATLSEPPHDEFRLVAETADYVIEALVKADADERALRYLSLRFAVCQPDSVLARFQETASRLSHEYHLQVSHGRTTSPFDDKESAVMRAEVLARRRRWQQIFEEDDELRKMPVGKAWQYFLEKHPGLV